MTAATTPDFEPACAWIRAGNATGTGYLVAPDLVATCHHVVESVPKGGEVTLEFEHGTTQAVVRNLDLERDAAVLQLPQPVAGVQPLRLTAEALRDDDWRGFGYPGVGHGAGVPIRGIVTRPEGFDDQRKPAIVLRCDELAAGSAAPAGGFSGTPVLVNGRVIGHLRRIIQDVGYAAGRPAFGVVWATPSRAVADLLGTALPAATTAPSPRPEARPLAASMEYHVFVSYRSTDGKWAQALVTRLEGAGLRVFFAPHDLEPGDLLMTKLGEALDRSASAVALLSKSWFESPWCKQESNNLLHRAARDSSFRLVPAILDEHPVEGLWAGIVALDFRGTAAPEGRSLERLLGALGGGEAPTAEQSKTDATDELFAEVRVAEKVGPREIMEVWRRWTAAGLPPGAAALRVAEALIRQARPQPALAVLDAAGEAGSSLRGQQLRALALAKRRKTDDAIRILASLREAGALDAETMGLLAGRYKQQWLRNRRATAPLLTSHETYLEAFKRARDPFVGINAAATSLWLGRREQALQLAIEVSAILPAPRKGQENWDLATMAEAALITGRLDQARSLYAQAVAADPMGVENIAVMRRGARLDLAALGRTAAEFDDVFAVPRVAAFAGHMIDAPGRAVPRFPRAKVKAVRDAIAERLAALNIGYGISSAAWGGDILFLEELLKREGRAQILLPFPADAFKATSVPDWQDRFDRIIADKRVEVEELRLDAPAPADQPAAFAACNREIHRRAVEFAEMLDEKPVLLAVWNGAPGDGAGGTADAIQNWQDEGYELDPIDITTL